MTGFLRSIVTLRYEGSQSNDGGKIIYFILIRLPADQNEIVGVSIPPTTPLGPRGSEQQVPGQKYPVLFCPDIFYQ